MPKPQQDVSLAADRQLGPVLEAQSAQSAAVHTPLMPRLVPPAPSSSWACMPFYEDQLAYMFTAVTSFSWNMASQKGIYVY